MRKGNLTKREEILSLHILTGKIDQLMMNITLPNMNKSLTTTTENQTIKCLIKMEIMPII